MGSTIEGCRGEVINNDANISREGEHVVNLDPHESTEIVSGNHGVHASKGVLERVVNIS